MYNWQFDGFLVTSLLSLYFGIGERLEYQTELMKTFRQYGAFEGREKELSWTERGTLEQIADEEALGKRLAEIIGRSGQDGKTKR